jgi:hypothetical protein
MRTVLVMASNASEIFVNGISDLVVIFGQASPKGSRHLEGFYGGLQVISGGKSRECTPPSCYLVSTYRLWPASHRKV